MSDINKSLQGPEMSLCANFGCSIFDCVRVWMETERDFMHYHVRWFNWLYLVLESIPLLNVVSGSVFWDYYPQLFPIFGFNYFTVSSCRLSVSESPSKNILKISPPLGRTDSGPPSLHFQALWGTGFSLASSKLKSAKTKQMLKSSEEM